MSKVGQTWKKYESGLYQEGQTHLYGSRGLGLEGGWPLRVRLFCRPDVTVIDLVPIQKQAEVAAGIHSLYR